MLEHFAQPAPDQLITRLLCTREQKSSAQGEGQPLSPEMLSIIISIDQGTQSFRSNEHGKIAATFGILDENAGSAKSARRDYTKSGIPLLLGDAF